MFPCCLWVSEWEFSTSFQMKPMTYGLKVYGNAYKTITNSILCCKKKAEECAEQTIMMPLNQTAEYVEIC